MTIRTLFAAAALLPGLLAADLPSTVALTTGALAAEPLRLRAEVTVHGALVTLGDLIDGAGEAAGVAVFRAPDLGTAGTVRAERIVEAAAANGLHEVDTGGIEQVLVSRVGRIVETGEIAGVIAARLVAAGRAGRIEDVDVALDSAHEPIVVEYSASAALTIDRFDHDPRSGRFIAILRIADSRAAAAGVRLAGRAVEIVEVPVLARAIERGEVISPADIVMERMPRSSVRPDAITDLGRLAGMSARRQLREGAPLTSDLLMEPILVRRGDLVTIVFQAAGITLTARGRALAAGGRGDVISLVNLQSNRTVEAEISGPGLATVLPQRVPFASLSTTVR